MKRATKQLFIIVLLASAVFSACARPPDPDDISYRSKREYVQFPEYGGYLPVVPVGPVKVVAPQWVLPSAGNDEQKAIKLPITPGEADRIIASRSDAKRKQTLSSIPEQVAGTIVGVALFPLFVISEPFYHLGASHHTGPASAKKPERIAAASGGTASDEKPERLGADIDIQVNGPDGNGVAGVRYFELLSPMQFKTYLDEKGMRSFASPPLEPFRVDLPLASLLAKHLPIHMGRYFRMRSNMSAPLGSVERPFRFQNGDATGRIQFMGGVVRGSWQLESVATAGDNTAPEPASYVIIWAPGYHPAVHAITKVLPGMNVQTTIVLQPLTNRDAITEAHAGFDALLAELEKLYTFGLFRKTPEQEKLMPLAAKMRSWIVNKELPVYFRWNVRQLAASHVLGNDDVFEALLSETAPLAEGLGPFLEMGEQNPWAQNDAYQRWRARIRRAQYSVQPFSAEEYRAIADEARTLLAKAEQVVPGYPLLNDLRMVIAGYDGNREQALRLSRYLEHGAFFYLYYKYRYRIYQPWTLK